MTDSPTIELLEKHRNKSKKPEDDNSFFTPTRDSRQAIMLEFILRNGKRHSWGYPYLNYVGFESAAEVQIGFTGLSPITIEGRNLLPLYKGLLEHRIRNIREAGELPDDLPEDKTVIYKIKL